MLPIHNHRRTLAVVLGTNEIASAVAVSLCHDDHAVVMVHDPLPPVIRRGMAFHDALFDERAVLAGIAATRLDTAFDVLTLAAGPAAVGVTFLGMCDLMALTRIAVLVDARMQKLAVMPVLRHLADVTVGLGPGFIVGRNCDVAVETRPARQAAGTQVVTHGATDAADGVASLLGGAGRERFVYSTQPGRWRTPFDVGQRLYRGMVAGHLDGEAVLVPMDGPLRGVVRDGTEVPADVKLLEIDPRGRRAQWTGIDERSRHIARATMAAIAAMAEKRCSPGALHLLPGPGGER